MNGLVKQEKDQWEVRISVQPSSLTFAFQLLRLSNVYCISERNNMTSSWSTIIDKKVSQHASDQIVINIRKYG